MAIEPLLQPEIRRRPGFEGVVIWDGHTPLLVLKA